MAKLDFTRVFLEVEKSRINREKSRVVLEKSIALYFILMVVAVVGFAFEYIGPSMLNSLIIIGIIILIIGTLPYTLIIRKEERKIDSFLKELK